MVRRKTASDERKRKAEQALSRISELDFEKARSFTARSVDADSFYSWRKFALAQRNRDAMRNAVYYGFQPIFDALINGNVDDSRRAPAIQVLNKIVEASVDYLTGYYSGQPNLKAVKARLRALDEPIEQLDGVPYLKKPRNVDHNKIYPHKIHSFLAQFLEHVLDGKVKAPDYVIGCACGASELAMPLAGFLEADIDFIRMSFRRTDSEPRIIPEQRDQISQRTGRRSVTCVEDYVGTGRSLQEVMALVNGYNPGFLTGTSCGLYRERDLLRVIVNNTSFRLFGLKK